MTVDEGKFIRVRYADDETGWVEVLESGRAKIANVPLCENLNIGDIVRLEETDPDLIPRVVEVLETKYAQKAAVRILDMDSLALPAIWEALRKLDVRIEGVVPGMKIMAFGKDVDLAAVLREVDADGVIEIMHD